jgi:hypothetical protein
MVTATGGLDHQDLSGMPAVVDEAPGGEDPCDPHSSPFFIYEHGM